jgi:hypothetical protein
MMDTWHCTVCREERPDAQISVVSADTSADAGFEAGTMKWNVKYCNDRPKCLEKALRMIREHYPKSTILHT